MAWKTVRLELSRNEEFPNGSAGRALQLRVPLDESGQIECDRLEREHAKTSVRRFWGSDPDRQGQLVRVDGHWFIHFPCEGQSEVLRFKPSPLGLNRRLLMDSGDGSEAEFRVVSISDVPRAQGDRR